ncbi:MAG TPA: anti-sigma factor antagonist [Acidimicrobiales bacterium]|nr:anti-sigma factor antagonist [Acidimicrobiales bacterium]
MIEISSAGRLAVVRLSGEFDLANSPEIGQVVADLLGGEVSDIAVDMSATTFIDAACLGALVAAHRAVERAAGRMVLVGLSAAALRLLAVSGLSQLLPVFDPPAARGRRPSPEPAAAEADLAAHLSRLAEAVLTERTLTGDLERVLASAITTIDGCVAASTAVLAQGRPRTATTTGRIAIAIDAAQYEAGRGPCLTAARSARRVRVDVLGDDAHFEHLRPVASASGVASSLSAPVLLGGRVIGSLNLYGGAPGAFDDEGSEATADVLAAQAALAVERSAFHHRAGRLTELGAEGAGDGDEVEAAQGALAALHSCTLDQAALLLQGAASDAGERLVDAARRVVSRLGAPPR